MKFVYNYPKYSEDQKKFHETNDCTVVTMAEVLGVEYHVAHKIMRERFKRKNRHGAFMQRTDFVQAMGEYKVAKGPYSKSNKISLAQFCKKHPVGRFYVLVRGHALAVIDGVVYDHSEKPRRMVYNAWRVHL
jgi:hypothetical protein